MYIRAQLRQRPENDVVAAVIRTRTFIGHDGAPEPETAATSSRLNQARGQIQLVMSVGEGGAVSFRGNFFVFYNQFDCRWGRGAECVQTYSLRWTRPCMHTHDDSACSIP